MKDHFKEKFQAKTKEELSSIIDKPNDYQQAAVEAALELLETHYKVMGVVKSNPEQLTTASPSNIDRNDQKIPYFRVFSSREIWSSLCSSSLFISIMWCITEFPAKNMDVWDVLIIVFSMYILINIVNHVFYKKEHKRSNGFLGGFFQLSMTTFWIYLFLATRSILKPEIEITNIHMIPVLLIMLFFAFLIEALTQFIRYLLILLKWRIW